MQAKWIDLADQDGRLKLGQIQGALYLFITGLPSTSPKWNRCIGELGFSAGQNNRYLVRRLAEGDTPKASTFRAIFPGARIQLMERDAYFLDFSRQRQESRRTEEGRQAEIDLTHYTRLGRNSNGDEVLTGSMGRVVRYASSDKVVRESDNMLRPAMFLRADSNEDMRLCADGFVRSMDRGEVQYREDLDRFVEAVYGENVGGVEGDLTAARYTTVRAHIEAALLRYVAMAHDTAQDAYGDAARLYDYLPAYVGEERGQGAMPLPLAVISQRLLGDMAGKRVVIPNAFDGSAYSFLSPDARIVAYTGARDLSAFALERDNVEWRSQFEEARDGGADAIFFNADPDGSTGHDRADYRDAVRHLRALEPGGRAVLTLVGDDGGNPGVVSATSESFLRLLATRYEIEDAFEIGAEMTRLAGTGQPLRVISLRNVRPSSDKPLSGEEAFPARLPVLHGWDAIKERVDETIARAQVREATSDEVDLKRLGGLGDIQRPYLPASQVGEARTMTPANLQGPIQSALSDVQARHGGIDEFVSRELGFHEHTLAERLSPEQVDAIGVAISRMGTGRGSILGDETGIGKGRTLASLAVWANKKGKNVVFITDRANLFSDFYGGDMGDLGERGRFRPLILNSGEAIFDKNSPEDPPPVLVPASRPESIRRLLDENQSMEEMGVNIVFATYSQINGEESEKATWLKSQMPNSLLIVDEAHIAAGDSSNMSTHVASMAQAAWAVQYSTATWAKSSKNLQIYARAMPETINVGTLASTMSLGGEAFAEVFSSMLAQDGALMRREHDMTRVETVIELDDLGREENIRTSDAVAKVMNAVAMLSGDVNRLMMRANTETVQNLKNARDVRLEGFNVNILSSTFGTGSMLYQVNRRMLAALNAPHVARIALRSIEEGLRPIIVFDDTGETMTNRLIDELSELLPDGSLLRPETIKPLTIRDLLESVVTRLGRMKVTAQSAQKVLDAVKAREEREERERKRRAASEAAEQEEVDAGVDPDAPDAGEPANQVDEVGEAEAVEEDEADIERAAASLESSSGLAPVKKGAKYITIEEMPGISDEDKATYKRGIDEINKFIAEVPDIPLNAPDVIHTILARAGVTTGEISGRKVMLRAEGDTGLSRIVQRSKKKAAVTATVRAYQNGSIEAILINRSAATGLGLHAQPRFADPRKRNMIWLQPPENPTEVTQLAGRANRYDQVCAPRNTFAGTGLYGETVQIMRNNRKQVLLACNVRSSREASVKFDAIRDLLNPVGRDVIQQVFADNPGFTQRMAISAADLENPAYDWTRALNRVSMLVHSDQERIYSEIFSAFDEAILRHELAGTNPLRMKEMDVGAKRGEQTIFLGLEMEGVGSAFDGAVYAQELSWKERMTPIAWGDVLAKIAASRQALIAAGRAELVQANGGTTGGAVGDVPLAAMSKLKENTIKQMDALVRIAVAADDTLANLAEALENRPPSHPVRRAHKRLKWLEDHLDRLMPGYTISLGDIANPALQRQAVIVSVEPPPVGKEHQLGRWKIETAAPTDNRPVTYSLSSIMNDALEALAQGEVQTVLGRDLFADEAGRRMLAVMKQRFDTAPTGERQRHATVLTGNMYLASEWANATKMGHGVIFTDESRTRHRGVILKGEVPPEMLRHMPIRLWSAENVRTFFERCSDSGDLADGVSVDLNYASAMAAINGQGERKARLIVGESSITLSPPGERVMVVARKLREFQKRLLDISGLTPTSDSGYCKIASRSTKVPVPYVTISAETTKQRERAIEMLISVVGVEIYANPHQPAGALARQIQIDWFERRKAAAIEQLQAVQGRENTDLLRGRDERMAA